jgi:ABC-type oligopeptide transport system substrate-binding subunit
MSLSARRALPAIAGALAVAACLLLAGCKEDKPPPTAAGFYDGPMKPKGATTNPKTAAGGQSSSAAGQP